MTPLFGSLLAGILICYFVCGIPFGLVIAKAKGIDIRAVGSHNIGTTNVARTLGKGAAAATLGCDVLKGLVAMLVSRWLVAAVALGGDFSLTNPQAETGWITTVLYLACICGHVFSPYLHFHGGKGIAVGLGAGLGCYWPFALSMLAVFILVVIPTRYVSAGSLAADASVSIWGLVYGFTPMAIVPLLVVTAIVLWAHRENFLKLIHGDERKFAFHKSSDGPGETSGEGDSVTAVSVDKKASR